MGQTFICHFFSVLEASLIATFPSFVLLLMNVPSGYRYERFGVKRLLFASMLIEGPSGLARAGALFILPVIPRFSLITLA